MESQLVEIMQQALWIVLILTAPPVVVAVVLGLLVSFVQAVTQIQEQTIQFAVKFGAIVLTLFLTAEFIGITLYNFGDRMLSAFVELSRR